MVCPGNGVHKLQELPSGPDSSLAMASRRAVRVFTGTRDVDVVLDTKAIASDFLLQVTEELGLKETCWFGLQYKDKKGRWFWLQLDKQVLSQKVDDKQDPLVMFLKVIIFPREPSFLLDALAQQSLIVQQVQMSIELEELLCSSACSKQLKNLAEAERVEQYLKVVEKLEEYGSWHFLMTRPHDPTPVRVSFNLLGITVTADNRQHNFPFTEIQEVSSSGKKLLIKYVSRGMPTTVFLGPCQEYTEDLLFLLLAHQRHFLTNNNQGKSTRRRSFMIYNL
nr:moesin-like isoform X1 [Procambarus clarkii]